LQDKYLYISNFDGPLLKSGHLDVIRNDSMKVNKSAISHTIYCGIEIGNVFICSDYEYVYSYSMDNFKLIKKLKRSVYKMTKFDDRSLVVECSNYEIGVL
jgi:hypothetical protein